MADSAANGTGCVSNPVDMAPAGLPASLPCSGEIEDDVPAEAARTRGAHAKFSRCQRRLVRMGRDPVLLVQRLTREEHLSD
jgi:hypothetical protein